MEEGVENMNRFPNEAEIKASLTDSFYEFVFDKPYCDVSKITDNVYLTSIGGVTKLNVEIHDLEFIYDLCEKDYYLPEGIEYVPIRVLDVQHQNICDYFDSVADKLHTNEMIGKKTLVHCFAGASRSATMVIAYLMKYHRLSLRNAFNHTLEHRQIIRPNTGFFRQLMQYEFKLFGSNSMKIIKVRDEVMKIAIEAPDFFMSDHMHLIHKELAHVQRGDHFGLYYGVPYN